jgi:kumamolisin
MAAPATSSAQVALPDSILPVNDTSPTAADPHKAYISRRTLRANELTQPINFEVALQLPNLAELERRVNAGEHISKAEMDARYQPSPANYERVVAWLTQQGFTVTRQDSSRIAVFASGRVDQLQNRLAVKFARVTADGSDYTSAISSPTVPADLAPLMVGINGLQPHLRMHRHAIRVNSTSGPGAPYEPSQLAQAYDASSLYAAGITGAGQTIAIVIDTFPLTSDLNSFWSSYGVNRGSSTVTFIQAVAGTLPSPSGEETLDTEWSSSIAPGANVRVYASKDLSFADLDQAYAQVYADVTATPPVPIREMTMSYGAAEYYLSTSQQNTDHNYFTELAAVGVTIFASSGDVGATPSNSGSGGGRHLTPESPSADPSVTGVGGTSLKVDANGNESSEVAWNIPFTAPNALNGEGASGGGISTYFARPSWQTGSTLPSSSMRLVPDIACSADPVNGAYVILNGSVDQYGGTSWSSPTWAGFAALLNQARLSANLSTLGLLNPYLYPLVGTSNFRDITSGNNAYEGGSGYNCATGYDLVTGCGVPDVANLAQTFDASPFQQWLSAHGYATTTADSATPDGDGIALLLKYATGMTPGSPSAAGPALLGNAGNFLTLSFNRTNPAAVNYIVEASSDLATWSTIANLAFGASTWTGPATVSETGAGPVAVTVTDNVAYNPTTPRFLRLRVTTATDTTLPGTVPQGDIALTVAGSGISASSLTLDNPPEARNTVQALSANTLTVVNAGSWANAANPYVVRLLTGGGSGATFAITGQSGNVLTLATNGVDLTQLAAVGDTYEVLPVETLGTLFGTSTVAFQTGSSASSADNIDVWNGMGWLVYFNNGASWRQAGSLLTQNNTPLPIGGGWLTQRRGTSPITTYILGRVPEVPLRQFTNPGGLTFLGGPYPLGTSLQSTGFAAAPGWLTGPTASSSDDLLYWTGTGWLTFYNNGTTWKEAGNLLGQNAFPLPAGQPLFVVRQSAPTPNQSFVLQPQPYTP